MANIKIGLIDDEKSSLDLLSAMIGTAHGFEVAFATQDPVKGLEWIKRGKAQVLITDLIMPELGGLEISRRLLNLGIPVIICSGYEEYGTQGFRVAALDFLVKPPRFSELFEALDRVKERIDADYFLKKAIEDNFVVVGEKLSHKKHFVRPSMILYAEQREKDTHVFCEGGSFVLTNPFMVSLEKLKSPYMVRIHQSYAVNIHKVMTLMTDECVLVNGKSIPVSRSYKGEIQNLVENKLIN